MTALCRTAEVPNLQKLPNLPNCQSACPGSLAQSSHLRVDCPQTRMKTDFFHFGKFGKFFLFFYFFSFSRATLLLANPP